VNFVFFVDRLLFLGSSFQSTRFHRYPAFNLKRQERTHIMHRRLLIFLLLYWMLAPAFADSFQIRCPVVVADNPFTGMRVRDGDGWVGVSNNPLQLRCGGALVVVREEQLRCVYQLGDHGVLVHQLDKPIPEHAECRTSPVDPCAFECTTLGIRPPKLKDLVPKPRRKDAPKPPPVN
jgi:hypothetical protein